jgi:transcriptional/translational regulatory protein YebC/TACO1
MFDAVGIVETDPRGKAEDAFIEDALVDGVIDVEFGEPSTVYTEMAQLSVVREALVARGYKVSDAYLGMRAKQRVSPEGEQLREVLEFLDALDENEDAQHVFSNLELSDAAIAALS